MKKKDILFLLASSVILVIAWIVFTLIHNALSSTINETVSAQIAPIPGTFDTQTITALKKRQQINSLFSVKQATPAATVVPTPTPTPITFVGSTSATITPNLSPVPTATAGGNKAQ